MSIWQILSLLSIIFRSNDDEEMCNFQVDIGYDIQHEEYYARTPACISESPSFNFCDHEETTDLCES